MFEIEAVGNVGAAPEMRYLDTGTEVTHFSLAATSGYGDKKLTSWIRITAFGKLAEVINQYVDKGTRLWVRIDVNPGENGEPRMWQSKQDGSVHASYDGKLKEWAFAGSFVGKDGKSHTAEESETVDMSIIPES